MWVKICGVRSVEAALHAQAAGADALGLNLHEPSPRSIPPEVAKAICRATTIPTYLVIVDPSDLKLRDWLQYIEPYGVQFHGAQTVEKAASFGYPYLKAYRAEPNCVPDLIAQPIKRILLDAFHPHLHGGSGKRVDETLVEEICHHKEVILAGGLTPDNVASIAQRLPIYGVDVASGVENHPGEQNLALITAFCRAAKEARR